MTYDSSQIYESYLPVYDTVPEKWEQARPFLVEILKKISLASNSREIGFFLEEQNLTGKSFIPSVNSPQEFRSIFRMTLNLGALNAGLNIFPHNINFDNNFTLFDLWVSATDSVAFNAITMSDPVNVTMDATNINVTSPAAFDRSLAVIEYLLEV